MAVPIWLSAVLLAFAIGSLAEYWGHRLMHLGFKKKKHIEHHRSPQGQGFLREFCGYACGSWPLFPVGLLHSIEAGVGFAVGALCYSAFAAYAHELQHEHPECCFWLSRPVHHLHHAGQMWQHNFGITFDIWDHVFATYRVIEVQDLPRRAWRNLFGIKWR